MKEEGIHTSTFMAHSTRGAATSKVKAVGVPIADNQQTMVLSLNTYQVRFPFPLNSTFL